MAASSSARRSGKLTIIVSRTVLRLSVAASGLLYGLSAELDCTMPASSADSPTSRSLALLPKYVCAAASMP
ncbi:Uncharacterised protein [Mycobacteroides abscessus subsp. abscessus]|nr:Uncharacterised protein [Mycobacteroides abscessus subsp. abscessus]